MSARRLQTEGTADQDASSLLFTIYLNIVIGGLLVICFELSRHLKQIYLVRMKKRFIVSIVLSLIHLCMLYGVAANAACASQTTLTLPRLGCSSPKYYGG